MLHIDTEIMATRPDIVLRKQKREDMHTDRRGNNSGEECQAKRKKKGIKYKTF
jgi:hypothetical protein